MKLQGTFITSSLLGFFPSFGVGTLLSVALADVDGLPLEVQGTNGNVIFQNGYINTTFMTILVGLKGNLAQAGQPIPLKSIKFVNNTVPAANCTIPASVFSNGTASLDDANVVNYTFPINFADPIQGLQYFTGLGGDDIDIEIEFDNSVIGIA